jgi:hypothetical protein
LTKEEQTNKAQKVQAFWRSVPLQKPLDEAAAACGTKPTGYMLKDSNGTRVRSTPHSLSYKGCGHPTTNMHQT